MVVRCPISSECIVQSSMFIAAGRSAIYTLVCALNNGADSMNCVPVVCLTLGNCSEFELFLKLPVNQGLIIGVLLLWKAFGIL